MAESSTRHCSITTVGPVTSNREPTRPRVCVYLTPAPSGVIARLISASPVPTPGTWRLQGRSTETRWAYQSPKGTSTPGLRSTRRWVSSCAQQCIPRNRHADCSSLSRWRRWSI